MKGSEADKLAALQAQLDAAERRYATLVEHLPVVTYVAAFDEVGTLMSISPQVEALLGVPPEAFLADGGLWERHIHPDDVQRVVAETARVFHDQDAFRCEYRLIAADGTERVVWERDTVVRDASGAPLYTQGVIVDISDLRAAEETVRLERDRAQRYLDVAGTAVLVLDLEGRVLMLNRAGHELVGRADGELVGCDWIGTCVPAGERAAVREAFAAVVATGEPRSAGGSYAGVLTSAGDVRQVEWRTTVLRDEDGRISAVLSSGLDVTERRAAEAQVEHLAYHDALTGLPNRALLGEHLDLALARAQRAGTAVALLYLDLDDFKLVNDSFGHAGGDELLRQVAARLDGRCRAGDLLARQGGDEFLLLLADLDEDPVVAAQTAADGLLGVLGEPFRIGAEEFHVGASVGMSIYPRDAGDADTLLRHADTAMYQAKAAGRSVAAPYEAQATASRDRLALTTRLRRAIEGDELMLHFQPIVSPQTGAVDALEALVRWEDPDSGLVPPAEFIPIAEETGLIEPLGEWVVDAICRQHAAWRADGVRVPRVHFNVSPRELRRTDFAQRVLAQLAHHGLAPGHLAVELTETTIMRERARSEPILRTLAEAGMRVAIDDFGAGYSSLTRLRDLPAHALKLDRAFLRGVPERPERAAMVTAILELASALGMAAIAEGVETEHQRAFLVAGRCPLAQGFHLGRPAPADALPALRARAGAPAA
ncbi:MAG: putative bifunctional diguanylate cyclase/phosphodiesterase [Solirubrobacteraceae bacterium]